METPPKWQYDKPQSGRKRTPFLREPITTAPHAERASSTVEHSGASNTLTTRSERYNRKSVHVDQKRNAVNAISRTDIGTFSRVKRAQID
jgi:hypothetical protein